MFEEADGVYVRLQGKDRKRSRQGKAEVKVRIAYDGWKQTGRGRYELSDKVAVAGFEGAKEFHGYWGMGRMENHVWSVIARRMKHNHTSWSRQGGNHLAKILAKKCSGKLYEVTERLKRPAFEEEKVEELYGEILMSAKAPKKEGKGYEYPVIGHMVGLEGTIVGDCKKLLAMAGF